tara:strand:- start:613 stop:1503 length:891 start_codon:yes stop_codon:yes gene_type:complete
MSYFPKRLLNTNLYTAGNEFLLDGSGEPYQGKYFEDYRGNYYTGADSTDVNIRKLVKNTFLVEAEQKSDPYNNQEGSKLTNTATSKAYNQAKGGENSLLKYGKDPMSFRPSPNSSDYQRGSIKRYFTKRVNSKTASIREINKDTFDSLRSRDGDYNFTIWRISLLNWKISGDIDEIRRINKNTVDRANIDFKGIKQYLRDLTQFAKNTKTTDLYTSGNEFINKRTGIPYRGYYHIHPSKGPMVGARHTLEKHDLLLPIGRGLDEIENERILEREDRIPTRGFGPNVRPQREIRNEY